MGFGGTGGFLGLSKGISATRLGEMGLFLGVVEPDFDFGLGIPLVGIIDFLFAP